jgi:hypothetical protein
LRIKHFISEKVILEFKKKVAVLSAFKKLQFDEKYDFDLIYQSIPDAVYNIMRSYNDNLISTIENATVAEHKRDSFQLDDSKLQQQRPSVMRRRESTVEELEKIHYPQSFYKPRADPISEDAIV